MWSLPFTQVNEVPSSEKMAIATRVVGLQEVCILRRPCPPPLLPPTLTDGEEAVCKGGSRQQVYPA